MGGGGGRGGNHQGKKKTPYAHNPKASSQGVRTSEKKEKKQKHSNSYLNQQSFLKDLF